MSTEKKSDYIKGILTIVVFFVATACFFGGGSEAQTPLNTEPNWSNYTPELKQRILDANCAELQREFDNAADNSDRQRARTGEGNLDLMNYIDDRLRLKGCY